MIFSSVRGGQLGPSFPSVVGRARPSRTWKFLVPVMVRTGQPPHNQHKAAQIL